jgi:hypothetical protein
MTAHDHKAVTEAEHALRWLTAFDLRAGKHADVIRAELKKLRQRCETLQASAIKVAFGSPCAMHSGDNAPPYSWWHERGNRCEVCCIEAYEAAIDRAGGGERENGDD